ncbi:Uncharacterized protein slr0245 [Durusdinium trenchii]|uniref:Uncharacterized protein slr0245 n=1 Tax=Durusdinium trenchii TaxID=1381693 RepID=A0ABP0LUC8_9DINO
MSGVRVCLQNCVRWGQAVIVGVVALMVGGTFASAAMPLNETPDTIEAVLGEWEPPDMDAVISIRECGETLCAELVRHKYADINTDINNPDPVMRARPLLGVRILDGLRRVKADRWKGGELYDPRTGKTYLSKLKVIDNNHLKITGCIGPGLCKGYVWRRVPHMTTLLYTHAAFRNHEVPPGHVEHPGRYEVVEKALEDKVFATLDRRIPPQVSVEDIERIHSTSYRELVEENAPAQGLAQFDADTFLGPSSLDAVRRAAGGAVAAVDALYAGEAKNAFIAARPPGHHAEPERAMGFCVFNGAAIAAKHAAGVHGAKRVAVLDFDVHHGNGTEAAFWHDEGAFYASSHEWPQYPGTGRETDRGAFDNIANAPLATGAGTHEFRQAWGERLLPALSDFGPDFIVISAGFDAHRADPLGGLQLDEDDFAWLTREIAGVARDKAQGRLISVLEGGYDLPALAASTAVHVKALMEA